MNREPWAEALPQSDAAYWKARCLDAEVALAKARAGVQITDLRRRILAALGDLRQGEWMDTQRAAEVLNSGIDQTFALLKALDRLGFVERVPGCRGLGGVPSRWRLGYLVQVPE